MKYCISFNKFSLLMYPQCWQVDKRAANNWLLYLILCVILFVFKNSSFDKLVTRYVSAAMPTCCKL